MYSIFSKEVSGYFSSVIGYLVIIVVLFVFGLFMWVLPGTNMLDYGYLSMDKFFAFAPWLLLFLIPAITMRMFPDELKSGTIELLLTKPITEWQLILGKYLASLALVVIALLPTIIYIFSLLFLASKGHVMDKGGIVGSYLGLVCLSAGFTAIGIFASALTHNQIVGFIISLIGCLIFYFGFDAISRIPAFASGLDFILTQFGMQSHYANMSKGLLDSRDIFYFITVVFAFLMGTIIILKKRNWEK
jgi:ABC-2 type transport system permease protein